MNFLLQRFALLIALTTFAMMVHSTETTDQSPSLVIFSATDTAAMQPIIDAFKQISPAIHIRYQEFQTNELFHAIQQLPEDQLPDLVISSAMDLQIKLVNDGYAQPFIDPITETLPRWANWRNEAFGFTYEPVAMVYNKPAFQDMALPNTHEKLALAIRSNNDFFMNRIATYDIRLSGVGYLFATQDEINSSISSRLKENLGRIVTKLDCCSSNIIEDTASGKLVLGYNVIGSYAMKYAQTNPTIGIIFPEDYTLVMSRVAFITRQARHVENARSFLRYLLSMEGQQIIADKSGLIALHPSAKGAFTYSHLQRDYPLRFKPIPLGPALMVYLDHLKQRRFINEWNNAILYDVFVP
ncbi:ABC transporter substrate-binding protein [Amphritea opalescens]|uniref:ABC transporter substrate-binding protein n=1 Tax=Amphritea opalescens TaxID=2490544 RepID=A0A430KUZ9_9GAMM|nr:ABC transporter substrate-binding protein [Amphritea opalescens]RTE67296.1 ABC transporter substrate-binding protein [Amphritea opalescens]